MIDSTSTMTERERGFWEALLAADGMDWDLRLIFADWLEDQGRPDEAEGQRWQAKYQKRPLRHQYETPYWEWYDRGHPNVDGEIDPASDLPHPVYRRLVGGEAKRYWRIYTSLQEAERDLVQALVKRR